MSTSAGFRRHASWQPMLVGASTTLQSRLIASSRLTPLCRHVQRRPLDISAVAVLLPFRTLSTETIHGPGTPTPGPPPPGFNADKAKKSLPKESLSKSIMPQLLSKENQASETQAVPKDVATGVSKVPVTDSTNLTDARLEGKAPTTAAASESTTEAKQEEKKLSFMQKVKKEILHYWDGTKLLATEIRISSKLALKMAAGYELSRREHRQLTRTVQDLGRLVPFSVFVIVPFAELLLPVALKLFPNLLPSTYEGQKSKDAKAKSLRATRKEVSNLLRNTLKETGLPVSPSNAQKEEFTEFFRKVRATGESPTSTDVIKVCKIFKDDLTLDNLSRAQLVGMARYMNLNTFGTDAMLRYQIRHRMRQIKRDDKAISFEGVDSLSVPELQVACASRGIRTHGVSPARLREDLQMWLDLRLKYGVPSTLLVLSNAFMYAQGKDSEISSQIDALTGVLSSIPEELFHEMELEVHNAEGAATNKQRLEVLKEQQDLIEEENEQNEETSRSTPKDDQDIDDTDDGRKADSGDEDVVTSSEHSQDDHVGQTQSQSTTPSAAAAAAQGDATINSSPPTSASKSTSDHK